MIRGKSEQSQQAAGYVLSKIAHWSPLNSFKWIFITSSGLKMDILCVHLCIALCFVLFFYVAISVNEPPGMWDWVRKY